MTYVIAAYTIGPIMGLLQERVDDLEAVYRAEVAERQVLEASVLEKLKPFPGDIFRDDIPLQDLVGYATLASAGDDYQGSFENGNTEMYRGFMAALGITEKEKELVDRAIRGLAFPWFAGQPLNIVTTVGAARRFVAEGDLDKLQGFSNPVNCQIARVLFS